MIIYVGKDYQDVSRKAANIMSAQIIMKPNAVLGLATGSTPVGLYKQLIEWYNKGDLDFSQITSVNLDEYKGLSGDNDQSYRYFMNTNLFDHVNIDKTRTYVPNGYLVRVNIFQLFNILKYFFCHSLIFYTHCSFFIHRLYHLRIHL